MNIYVVYDNPTDYPGKFVVRAHRVISGGSVPEAEPRAVTDTLDEARKVIPDGLIRFVRDETDDAKIVETWL